MIEPKGSTPLKASCYWTWSHDPKSIQSSSQTPQTTFITCILCYSPSPSQSSKWFLRAFPTEILYAFVVLPSKHTPGLQVISILVEFYSILFIISPHNCLLHCTTSWQHVSTFTNHLQAILMYWTTQCTIFYCVNHIKIISNRALLLTHLFYNCTVLCYQLLYYILYVVILYFL